MIPSRRPNLLFLCQTLPYPPDGGVWIRTFNVIKLLASEFRISLLCFERSVSEKHGFRSATDLADTPLGEYVQDVQVFPIAQRRNRVRFALDHFRSAAQQRVFTEFLYRSRRMREAVRQAVAARRHSLAHVDSLDLSYYLPVLRPLPVVCVHHNVESELLARRAEAERSAILRKYVALQATLMSRVEKTWCPQVALNVVVSERDRVQLLNAAGGGTFAVVPNGVDTDFFQPSAQQTENAVVFMGGTNWFPNRDALLYFCDAILPKIRRECPTLKVRWVGAATEADRVQFARDFDVELTGYVDDVRPYVHAARCFVVPLRVGGGSRLKILDAWAMGKAVVTTSVGAEGLTAQHDSNVLLADSADHFANAVLRVVSDGHLRRRLEAAGRRTVEDHYSWAQIGRHMIPLYVDLAAIRRYS